MGGEKKVSIEYALGMPLVAAAIAWYGLSETLSANQEEAIYNGSRKLDHLLK